MAAATYPAEPDATKAIDYQSVIALPEPDRVNGDAVSGHADILAPRTPSLDPTSVEKCACSHDEWQHVWNSVSLPDGRGPFSEAACSVSDCGCQDFVYLSAIEAMVARPAPPAVTHTGDATDLRRL